MYYYHVNYQVGKLKAALSYWLPSVVPPTCLGPAPPSCGGPTGRPAPAQTRPGSPRTSPASSSPRWTRRGRRWSGWPEAPGLVPTLRLESGSSTGEQWTVRGDAAEAAASSDLYLLCTRGWGGIHPVPGETRVGRLSAHPATRGVSGRQDHIAGPVVKKKKHIWIK